MMDMKCDICGAGVDSYRILIVGGFRSYGEAYSDRTGIIRICPACAKNAGILSIDSHKYEFIDTRSLRDLLILAIIESRQPFSNDE
jgi:hypothetical protein